MEMNYQNDNPNMSACGKQEPRTELFPAEYFERKAERKILRRRANWMGSELLFIQIFEVVATIMSTVALAFMGWQNGQGGVYAEGLKYVFFSPIGLMIPAIIIAYASGQKLTNLIPFKKISFSSGFGFLLFGLIGISLGGIMADTIATLLPVSTKIMELSFSAVPTGVGEWITLVLYSAAIPALVEEFVFRGVILNSFRRYGDAIAIWISAIMFTLVHGNVLQFGLALPSGLILGYVTVCSGNIWIAVAIHFLNNALSSLSPFVYGFLGRVINNIFGGISSELNQLLCNVVIYTVFVVLSLVGLIIIKQKAKKGEAEIKLKPGTVTCLTKKEKKRAIFFAPTLVIGAAFYILQALLLLIPQFVEATVI